MTEDTKQKEPEQKKGGFFSRLKEGLQKTRSSMVGGLSSIIGGKGNLGPETMEELEEALLKADVGLSATHYILEQLREGIKKEKIKEKPEAMALLQRILTKLLDENQTELEFPEGEPLIILMVGINGSGKTTTIGKLSAYWKGQGKSLLIAAGDTFRAAAIEQLQVWAKRGGITCVHQKAGSDPSAVAYDGVQAAVVRKMDLAMIDTAGRLQTNTNLMEELKKVKRVIGKVLPTAPHEVWLVLDSSIGQNSISQARLFHEALGVTGLVMTKLDGSGKGGVLFYLAREMKIPVRFIGVGEQTEDLQPFVASDFVSALLAPESSK
ncbi:MAG: signal recognition particle-docking protein FtsY [Nitrospinae bacterium CG11_big_fil_rev_8_21_14_0_20_45_15]|nr:MAG: signal recognition particle-docking protein FtsY [Nitrospinae bacterium CG11_big_fil_rev_8_21_14_0_20_45_15]